MYLFQAYIEDLPGNTRLSTETHKMAVNAMNLKCSKKHLQNKIMLEKNVKIRIKDLSNIQMKNEDLTTNDLHTVEKILKCKGKVFIFVFEEMIMS